MSIPGEGETHGKSREQAEPYGTAEARLGRSTGKIFSLRLKITLTFLIAGAIVSGMLSYTVYRILDANLLRQMQARVLDLAQLGARLCRQRRPGAAGERARD